MPNLPCTHQSFASDFKLVTFSRVLSSDFFCAGVITLYILVTNQCNLHNSYFLELRNCLLIQHNRYICWSFLWFEQHFCLWSYAICAMEKLPGQLRSTWSVKIYWTFFRAKPIHNKCRGFSSNLTKNELKPRHLLWIGGSIKIVTLFLKYNFECQLSQCIITCYGRFILFGMYS
jgi:hypothetical protein